MSKFNTPRPIINKFNEKILHKLQRLFLPDDCFLIDCQIAGDVFISSLWNQFRATKVVEKSKKFGGELILRLIRKCISTDKNQTMDKVQDNA